MKNVPAQKLGFTLIELMIVVTITVIIAGFSFISVNDFTQNQGTTDDARTFISELRRVYSKATAVFYPPGCTGLTAYGVTYGVPTSTDVRVNWVCNVGSSHEDRLGVLKSSKFIGSSTITFNVPDGAVTPNGALVQILNSSLTDVAKAKNVNVFSNGVFNLQ